MRGGPGGGLDRMGEYVIKASPDHQVYLIWSTYTDCPIYIFKTRQETLDYLYQDHDMGAMQGSAISSPEARLERADESGCSSLAPPLYHWDDEYLLVVHDAPPRRPGHYWMLPRKRLFDYCKIRLQQESIEETYKLFELFIDESE